MSTCATGVSTLLMRLSMRARSSFVAMTNKEFTRISGMMRTPWANCRKPEASRAEPAAEDTAVGGGGIAGGRAPELVVPAFDVRRTEVGADPVMSEFSNDAI